jgi:hypothetical protein
MSKLTVFEQNSNEKNEGVTIGILIGGENSLQGNFDTLLIEAIDEVITSLGEPVKNTLYFQLDNDFKIDKETIPEHINEFSDIIHKIFGLGASRIEVKSLKILYSKIRRNNQWPEFEYSIPKWIELDLSFEEYVNNVRNKFLTLNSENVIQEIS